MELIDDDAERAIRQNKQNGKRSNARAKAHIVFGCRQGVVWTEQRQYCAAGVRRVQPIEQIGESVMRLGGDHRDGAGRNMGREVLRDNYRGRGGRVLRCCGCCVRLSRRGKIFRVECQSRLDRCTHTYGIL